MISKSTELFSYRIPGVANEFWPIRRIPTGGENYGWGATLPMFILRSIVGFRELDNHTFMVSPTFPALLAARGRTFQIQHLHYRDFKFDLSYILQKEGEILVTLDIARGSPDVSAVESQGKPVAFKVSAGDRATSVSFSGSKCNQYTVSFK